MALKRFRKIHSTADELNQVQDNIKSVLDPLMRIAILDCNVIPNVALANGSNTISHGLGRNYVDAFACVPSATARLSQGASPDRSQFVVIDADAPCVATVVVF